MDAPGEWRRTSDFQLLASLSGDIDRLVFSPDGAYVGFAYVDAPGELRRVSDGQIIATFGCDICELVFSQDGAYLTVLYDSFAGSELWAIGDDVRLLAHYDRGQGFPFLGTQRLAVQYYNVYALRAFLLDLDWLRAMGGDPAALAPEELVNILCQGPMALGLLPKTDLLPYLAGRLSQACN